MLSEERSVEIRNYAQKFGTASSIFLCVEELLAEIDRLRAASVPPAGAVKVRVAVTMNTDGSDWFAIGGKTFSDEEAMSAAENECVGYPTAYGDLYVMPPKTAEVTGEVEGV